MTAPRIFFESSGNLVSLLREIPPRLPLGRPSREVIPFAGWPSERPERAVGVLGRICQALEDGERAADGDPLVMDMGDAAGLHPDFVAQLTDSEAATLDLPPATHFALSLRSSGLIHRDGFRIDTSWTRAGGVPIRATAKDGRLHYQGREWRIPEPLYSTLASVEAVNAAPDEARRQAALAELKSAMGEDASSLIRPDGIIERLRLAYASGFSLSLKPEAAGVDFDPVLFSRERLSAATDGQVLDEAADSLLTPALASGFARRFRAGDGERRAYLLDDGSLLYIDPQLTRVLGAVRTAQTGTPEQRRAFAAAPERHIAEVLRSAGENADDAAHLFIETEQFSQRVAGIDVWRKPVLPWIKPRPNSWLPEAFGLRVGDPPDARTFEIAPTQICEAAAAARCAVQEERSTFEFGGMEIPATPATLNALESLAKLANAASQPLAEKEQAPESLRQRYFLQVQDNLEDLVFAPLAPTQVEVNATPANLPGSLLTPPKAHQIVGFRWLAACWLARIPGALLADDMGLGKTYQGLAFIAWLRGLQRNPRPVLIVAPSGLLANWQGEIRRHLQPDALGQIVSAYGTGLAALRQGAPRDIESGAPSLNPSAFAQAGLVLTTYETMRDYHLSFARQPFAAILYDEAQKLKNPASQLTRGAKTLNAQFQLALTGTPIENRMQDLWSIYDVIYPGLLGASKAFEETYCASPEALKALHAMLTQPQGVTPPALLRRMKEDCLDSLPAKRIVAMPIEMPPPQAAAYERVLERALAVKGTAERGRMLEVLHQLRGVSLHPASPTSAGADAAYFADSARLAGLFTVLADVAAKGEKALIFCESLAMQGLLAVELRYRFALPHPVPRIHGGVSGDARQAAVDVFQSRGDGFDVMILSPKAGGVGLTLTSANHVIHLSRWWNPAVEDQATDRAYRIGQTRDVTVYLPQSVHPDAVIGPSSFDIKLDALLARKRELGRGLFAPGDDEGDTGALFDLVVVPTPVTDPMPTIMPASIARSTPHPSLPPDKPSLRARLAPRLRPAAQAPIVRERTACEWPRRVVYEEGGLRDKTIFTAPVAHDPIREMFIVDPYAAAGARARRATVDFAKLLINGQTGVGPVNLATFDADSVQISDPESSETQFADMHDRWGRAFGGKVALQFHQVSKRGNRQLHDREIRATTQSGRKLVWDLGHGIDGVMTARYRCVVVLTED